jgi:hypothetical protein
MRFGDNFFLPAAGLRYFSVGTLFYRGSSGYYWGSSEVESNIAWDLSFDSGGAGTGGYTRTTGFSIRCIAE